MALAALAMLTCCGDGKTTEEAYLDEISNAKIVPAKVHDSSEKFGYVDNHGNLAIPAKFNAASYFHEGVALIVDTTDMCGYIKDNGAYVINPQYASATDFTQGLAWVAEPDSVLKVIDTKGNVKFRFPKAYTADAFMNSLAIYHTVDGKAGLVNTKGEDIKLSGEFKDFTATYGDKVVGRTTDNKTVVCKIANDALTPVEIPGNPDIEEVNLKNELIIFYMDGKRGVMNFKGEYLVNPRYTKLGFDGNDLIIFGDDKDKYGWIDLKGNVVIPAKYKAVAALFDNTDYAIVSTTKTKYQTIDRKGNTIIKAKYKKLYRPWCNPSILGMAIDDQFGLISADGKELCEPQFSDVHFCSKDIIMATPGNSEWGVINEAGQFQGSPSYTPVPGSSFTRATSQYVSASEIVNVVMDFYNNSKFGISWPDLASRYTFTKYDADFYQNAVQLKSVKLPGTSITFSAALNDYAITNARNKSNAKLNPQARPVNYFISIKLSNQAKCDEVFAALEKATGIEGGVSDIEEIRQYQDVDPYTIDLFISPEENFLNTAK